MADKSVALRFRVPDFEVNSLFGDRSFSVSGSSSVQNDTVRAATNIAKYTKDNKLATATSSVNLLHDQSGLDTAVREKFYVITL
jgi:uncharacterized lipoprotein YajG